MKRIASQENPVIKGINKLKRKKTRDRECSYLIEGFHLISEALENNIDLGYTLIKESLLANEWNEELSNFAERLKNAGAEVFRVPDNIFNKLTETETPQGLLSVVKRKEWDHASFFNLVERPGTSNILVLDRLQDPGNTGTVLRTADAAGYSGTIIIKGTADVYGPKVVRAASGSIFRLPLLFLETPEEAVQLLRRNGKTIIATTPYCNKNYYECKMNENIALIIGNEGGGISDALLRSADIKIKIPMREPVESLNAAVAAGILMYESMRQNNNINGGRD